MTIEITQVVNKQALQQVWVTHCVLVLKTKLMFFTAWLGLNLGPASLISALAVIG